MSMPGLNGARLDVVDVANDERLMERYGEKIPVLRQGQAELAAPFTAEDLAHFLSNDPQAVIKKSISWQQNEPLVADCS